MSAPSVTYQFITGTLISEKEHNQNNADLIAALTDGTKDLTIGSLLTNNHGTFYGTLSEFGSSNSDTITANAKVDTSIKPSSTSINLGSTSFPWRAIYLDNGATDGGAVYFGSSSKYMKCSADGTTIALSGFTTYDFNSTNLSSISSLSNVTTNISGNISVSGTIYNRRQMFFIKGLPIAASGTYNVASDVSNNALSRHIILPKNGSVWFVSVRTIATTTGGTLSMDLYKNGSLLLSIGNTQTISTTGAYTYTTGVLTKGANTFSALDALTIRQTASSSPSVWSVVTMGVYYDS